MVTVPHVYHRLTMWSMLRRAWHGGSTQACQLGAPRQLQGGRGLGTQCRPRHPLQGRTPGALTCHSTIGPVSMSG